MDKYIIQDRDIHSHVKIKKGAQLEGLHLKGVLVVFECDSADRFDRALFDTAEYVQNCSFVNCNGTTDAEFSKAVTQITIKKAKQ